MIAFKKHLTIFTISMALFMDVLDTNIINTAIPAMSRSFNVNPIDLKIALISYLLSLAIFIPISGWIADKYGTKNIFIYSMGLFTISSFCCGYSNSISQLVIARCIQGIGGAFMISIGRLIIARIFKKHELVNAMNAVIIVVAVAVMIGPFLGGVITQYWSWPWIFWVNIPAGILTMILAVYLLEDKAVRKTQPFDMKGFILFGGGLAFICYALSELSESNVNFSSVIFILLTGLTLLIAYTIHAKYYPYPVIQLNLFQRRTFRISVLGNLFARLGFGGTPFLLPLMEQLVLGLKAELAGLLLVPMAFGIIFSKIFVTQILRVTGYKRFLIVNTILVGLNLWLFQFITQTTSLYFIAGLTFLFGIFIAAQFTGMNSLAFADIHEDELSASTSITSTTQVLAQSLGVAVAAILLRFYSSYQGESLTLTLNVFHKTFFSTGIITFLSIFIFIFLKPEDGKQMLRTPDH